MPCFHGLAVSIHTTGAGGGPLSEHGIQKQAKHHRITTHIPVPPPKLQPGTTKPEPVTFAISITLLTPGLNVPYSTPSPSIEDPHPRPKVVGGNSDTSTFRGKHSGIIAPYTPLTSSANETIAAYIYFDGRPKEEVATLLRRGEETWVNSRWVSVPDSEGGGLAEKEFIFREVGLERWLNGLDLEGKDANAAATIERRRKRFERKRKGKKTVGSDDEDDLISRINKGKRIDRDHEGILRYGADKNAPIESLSDDNDSDASDTDSEDDAPMPESAGQIKVALFRVLASGEVKRGEYSPQFDVHDDEETMNGSGEGDADIDHTTSFAKPRTLDPKSISTQTVTGIDPPDKPYAVFTFYYRGQQLIGIVRESPSVQFLFTIVYFALGGLLTLSGQLQKMGILPPPKEAAKTPVAAKRQSKQLDFGNIAPLSTSAPGTKNFAGYRDAAGSEHKGGRPGNDDAMDSDNEDDDDGDKRIDEDDSKDQPIKELSLEEAMQEEKLSEDVRKIRLKRHLSAEPLNVPSPKEQDRKQSPLATTPTSTDIPTLDLTGSSNGIASFTAGSLQPPPSGLPVDLEPGAIIGSPFKKQRASLPGFDEGVRKKLGMDSNNVGPRRESEGGIASVFSSGCGGSFPAGVPEETISKFEPGPPLKKPDQTMEEEL
ncbi:hypothetical protein EG327_007625 [Venturia inaequalis]|uniref:DUF7918 domain-containing protein n=1 Tax=Venturia inaequalis TaxID=5025 RepID=A0A8H3UYM9_VENIN|nr:hypothetical protein EG327_007625 [Venturia inaequalis]